MGRTYKDICREERDYTSSSEKKDYIKRDLARYLKKERNRKLCSTKEQGDTCWMYNR